MVLDSVSLQTPMNARLRKLPGRECRAIEILGRMKNIALGLILASLVATLLPRLLAGQALLTKLPPPQHRYALLIGVNVYDEPGITPLEGPNNDVELLRKTLVANAGFDNANIKVLVQDGVPSHRPTRTNILKSLSKIRQDVPADGDALLLVMFSGHGITTSDRHGFLLPEDAASIGDVRLLATTSLSIVDMKNEIEGTGAKQTIVFLDACRDDPERSKSARSNTLTKAFHDEFDFGSHNKGISASVVFYAADIDERAYVDHSRQLGYFTEVLVEALAGAASNVGGTITLNDLTHYIQSEVPKRVQKDNVGLHQKPIVMIEGYRPNDLIISNRSSEHAPKELASATLGETMTTSQPLQKQLEIPLSALPSALGANDTKLNGQRQKLDSATSGNPYEALDATISELSTLSRDWWYGRSQIESGMGAARSTYHTGPPPDLREKFADEVHTLDTKSTSDYREFRKRLLQSRDQALACLKLTPNDLAKDKANFSVADERASKSTLMKNIMAFDLDTEKFNLLIVYLEDLKHKLGDIRCN
jgi:hypothetical protein